MIIDSSAVIAILKGEPDAVLYTDAIEAAFVRKFSAANYLEAAVVMDACRNPIVSRRFDEFLSLASVQIVSVTQDQAEVARQAYRDFGKGSGHKAGLNFGDCFAYALAKTSGEPLLFKGNDFSQTDIYAALKS